MLNKFVGTAHPNIYKAVLVLKVINVSFAFVRKYFSLYNVCYLKTEENTAVLKYKRVMFATEKGTLKPASRRNRDVAKDIKIKTMKRAKLW